MPTTKPIAQPLSDAAIKAGMDYAMDALKRMPQGTPEDREAHITGMLVIFWGALWGTMGTDYARDFIKSQLSGMKPDQSHDVFTPPRKH